MLKLYCSIKSIFKSNKILAITFSPRLLLSAPIVFPVVTALSGAVNVTSVMRFLKTPHLSYPLCGNSLIQRTCAPSLTMFPGKRPLFSLCFLICCLIEHSLHSHLLRLPSTSSRDLINSFLRQQEHKKRPFKCFLSSSSYPKKIGAFNSSEIGALTIRSFLWCNPPTIFRHSSQYPLKNPE